MTTTAPEPRPPHQLQPVAAVLALLFPGAGHAYLGHVRRGVLIAIGVMGLFLAGLLIGGIDAVDRREDFVWFLGQGFVGPVAFATDYYHQNYLKVRQGPLLRSAYPNEIRDPRTAAPVVVRDPRTGDPTQFVDPRTGQVRVGADSDRPPNTKSVGHVNEVGTLYAAIAGMLNLICVVDAGTRRRAPARAGGGRA